MAYVMKKIINDPHTVADEAIDGIVLAAHGKLRRLKGMRVVVRSDAPVKGKVALICGGGSGHEPAHTGYVGKGMLDAAVMGDVFTSPPPAQILAAIREVNGGAGVLLIIWNYTGDIINFTEAAELARDEGIEVDWVIVNDDVAIPDVKKRRGVGTTIFVEKIAGAKAEERASLKEVKEVAERVIANGRSMGAALGPCVLPALGKPTFEIGPDEMELGIGIHGEPGVKRVKLMKSKELAKYLVDNIVKDLGLKEGEEVALMVQGMGGTSNMEKFIFFKDVYMYLTEELGIKVYRSFVGEYTPSMEMAGVHITILRLDDELKRLLDAPTEAPAWHSFS